MSFPLVGNLSSKKDAGQAGMTDLGSFYIMRNLISRHAYNDADVGKRFILRYVKRNFDESSPVRQASVMLLYPPKYFVLQRRRTSFFM